MKPLLWFVILFSFFVDKLSNFKYKTKFCLAVPFGMKEMQQK